MAAVGERNDVALAGLNHKMGYRGTVNTLLNFGEGRFRPEGRPGAIGYLVGEPHRGLACMFHMMNEARIGVGLGAVALGYAGYLESLEYARNRPQGRPVASKDPATPQVRIVEHADVRRMLLAQKAYVEGGLALNLYCARLVDEQHTAAAEAARAEAGLLLEILTPIAKSWPSQWCLAANDLAIQVHGGYGYTRDYPVEQLYRDNRLNPIHEGTHGIQALDLLGRKVTMERGRALELLGRDMARTLARARATRRSGARQPAAALERAVGRVVETTRALYGAGDIELTLANATVYLEAFGHVVLAWIWLEQAWPRTARPVTSTTASARPAATSSAGSCRARARNSICSPASTTPRSRCATTGSRRDARGPLDIHHWRVVGHRRGARRRVRAARLRHRDRRSQGRSARGAGEHASRPRREPRCCR